GRVLARVVDDEERAALGGDRFTERAVHGLEVELVALARRVEHLERLDAPSVLVRQDGVGPPIEGGGEQRLPGLEEGRDRVAPGPPGVATAPAASRIAGRSANKSSITASRNGGLPEMGA